MVSAVLARDEKGSITEAKNRLSAFVDGLKRGAPVLIVDRGRPVARLEPVTRLGEEALLAARLLQAVRGPRIARG